MANLKDHQQAMVDLMASGSGIPASAMRLAHAMHDVLAYLNLESAIHQAPLYGADATTPGLNDKALAEDIRALQVNSPAEWPVNPAERRVKELENTVKQLRAQREKDKNTIRALTDSRDHWAKISSREPEQAGCRKDDTQVCEHSWSKTDLLGVNECLRCG